MESREERRVQREAHPPDRRALLIEASPGSTGAAASSMSTLRQMTIANKFWIPAFMKGRGYRREPGRGSRGERGRQFRLRPRCFRAQTGNGHGKRGFKPGAAIIQ